MKDCKVCLRCGNEKNIEDFPFKNKRKNIRHSTCKECWKIIRKKSYNENKKTTLERNKRNRIKNREWYNEYKKTLKCNRCPENHPACLEFHHEDSNEKEFNVSELIGSTYSVEKIMEEIEKCEVLCSNCHRKHHHKKRKTCTCSITG